MLSAVAVGALCAFVRELAKEKPGNCITADTAFQLFKMQQIILNFVTNCKNTIGKNLNQAVL